jgi:hypothetical protein
MSSLPKHLERIHARSVDAIADEVRNIETLIKAYPSIGLTHPADEREAHVQHVVFAGLRNAGYFTMIESNYFVPRDSSRRIDLATWIPDASRWLYLEVKPCSPIGGCEEVLLDARKLLADQPTDPRDLLRGMLVYGFRDQVGRDGFPDKYREMSTQVQRLGFNEVRIEQRELRGTRYSYAQVGLWAIGLDS